MDDARNTFSTILKWAAALYGAVLLLLLAAPLALPQPSLDGLAHTALALLLLPAPLLVIVALLLRAWSWSALLGLAAIGFGMVYGGVLVPRSAEAPANGRELTVLTFNVQRADSPDEVESIANIIRGADADVVAMQELSAAAADGLSDALHQRYPYQALHGQEEGHLGQGVFSKYPIRQNDYWRNPALDVTLGHMWAELEVDGRVVWVFSAHPVPPYSPSGDFNARAHDAEIESVLSRAAERCGPVLMVGDWNMTDQFPIYDRIARTYTDTYREASGFGFGFSYPNGRRLPVPPLVRIDHVFHNAAFDGIEAHTLSQSGTSDHRPLVVRLALLPEDAIDLGCE